jgi:hypothetical protein
MLKLGKKEFKTDNRDLRLFYYIDKDKLVSGLPSSYNHDKLGITWQILGNDNYGDCVIAGAAHETLIFNVEGGKPVSFTDNKVIADYHTICGSGDPGCDVRTVLGYRQKTGIHDANSNSHKIAAYTSLDIDKDEIQLAVYYFSAVGIGIQFPSFAMDQFNNNQVWDVQTSNATIEGGHYIPIIGYDSTYLYCVTWGQIQPLTYAFFNKYCDEAWCLFSLEELKNGISVEGFNQTQLQTDLTNIHNKPAPVTPPTPVILPNVAQAIADAKTGLKSYSSTTKNTYLNKILKDLGG